jgi:DNA-binding NarL/FixJ family response regulator
MTLMLKGYENKEIAKELYISTTTLDGHRSNIYKKLGVHSFRELVRKWGVGIIT